MKTLKEFCKKNRLKFERYEKWALEKQYSDIADTLPNEIRTSKYIFDYDDEVKLYKFTNLKNMAVEYVLLDTKVYFTNPYLAIIYQALQECVEKRTKTI